MITLVNTQIKDPSVKRRHSLTSFRETLPRGEQKRAEMPSCFDEEVSFNEYTAKKEQHRQTRVEWRAQFIRLNEIVESQRRTRWEDKQRRRDKSSDAQLINNALLTSIHQRATEDEIRVLTELSFWEKIGF